MADNKKDSFKQKNQKEGDEEVKDEVDKENERMFQLVRTKTMTFKKAFVEKVPFFQVSADIHLLVGYLFSIFLPLAGFIGCCVLVRYKDDYAKCLEEHDLISKEHKHFHSSDRLITWLRRLHSLTFAFSISYFFFIQRSTTLLTLNSILY